MPLYRIIDRHSVHITLLPVKIPFVEWIPGISGLAVSGGVPHD